VSAVFAVKINREELEREMRVMRLYPGAAIPFRAHDIELIMLPASTSFPIDWSKTRWPEGAEL
jgi:hypothetical protein